MFLLSGIYVGVNNKAKGNFFFFLDQNFVMFLRLVWSSLRIQASLTQNPPIYLLSAGIIGVYHHTWVKIFV